MWGRLGLRNEMQTEILLDCWEAKNEAKVKLQLGNTAMRNVNIITYKLEHVKCAT